MIISEHSSLSNWLSSRVRLMCIIVFVGGSLLPPYVPKAALAPVEDISVTQQFLLVEDGFLMKSSSLTRQGARRAYAQGVIHTVKEGESLERLAQRYGIKVKTIQWANDLEDGGPIRPGDELLVLPTDGVLHNVSRGQTLSRIAQLYDIDSDVIAKQNDISGGFILAGQELIIPGGTPIVGKPVIIATVDPSPDVDIVDRPDTPTTTTDDDVVTDTADIAVLPTPPRGVEATPTAGVLQKPCSENCFYTQYYRPGHYAVDMQERGGGPIYAAEAGTVIRSEMGWNGGFGNVIEVDHGNGLVTLYAHNKELYVKKGETVYRGQNISWMGNSGLVYGKTGIHVHFEVRLHGVKKNPIYYIE